LNTVDNEIYRKQNDAGKINIESRSNRYMTNEEFLKNYDSLSLKKLEPEIKKKGFMFRLVKRTNERLLYSQHNGAGRIIAYEVFLNRIRPYKAMKEQFAKRRNENIDYSDVEEWCESYPSDEEFGKRAWTYPNLEMATQAFEAK
jgi:hypothetical protein